MKFVKLLTVPAVLLLSVLTAVPAFAHAINESAITIGCGTGDNAGRVCVTISGTLSDVTERFVFVDIFPKGADITATDAQGKPKNSLGEIVFDIKGSSTLPMTRCFDKIQSTATSFTVAIMKVTSDSAGTTASDLDFDSLKVNGSALVINGRTVTDLDFNATDDKGPVALTDVAACATTPTQQPPSGGGGGGQPPTANTAVPLASTGGFDFRFPLIGLLLLVAGGALFVISASRGRSADTE